MRERPRAYAIVNPAAGHGRGARLVRTIGAEFEAAGMTLEVAVSPGPGEAARLASSAVDDGHTVVLAVGGDGTANEVANGMIGGPAALLADENIKKVECIDFPELGMEAVWKIEVENFPAYILVDDKGNDFFKQLGL